MLIKAAPSWALAFEKCFYVVNRVCEHPLNIKLGERVTGLRSLDKVLKIQYTVEWTICIT